jgi:hypothetical protein
MTIPSKSIGPINSLRNYTTDGLIANFDCGHDYSLTGTTFADLTKNGVSYSTPGGYVALVKGSTAAPAFIDLDGASDYLVASSSPAIFNSLNGLTVCAWIRPAGTLPALPLNHFAIASTNSSTPTFSHKGWGLGVTNSGITVNVNTGSNIETETLGSISINVWTFLTVTFTYGSGTTVNSRIYYSNGTIGSNSTNFNSYGSAVRTQNPVHIGRRSNTASNYFNGDISLVRIYSRVLSTSELDFDYARSKLKYGH